jgi:hypothetical protein
MPIHLGWHLAVWVSFMPILPCIMHHLQTTQMEPGASKVISANQNSTYGTYPLPDFQLSRYLGGNMVGTTTGFQVTTMEALVP